jgi:anti-anti-sigma factor
MAEAKVVVVDQTRIDYETSPAFQERLLQTIDAGPNCIVLDLSAVKYISSAGLRALVVASRKAKDANGKIAIAALQPLVLEVFKISRFDVLFSVYETVDAALTALQDSLPT